MHPIKSTLAAVVCSLGMVEASHGFPALPQAERSGNELAALEQKLHGSIQVALTIFGVR